MLHLPIRIEMENFSLFYFTLFFLETVAFRFDIVCVTHIYIYICEEIKFLRVLGANDSY